MEAELAAVYIALAFALALHLDVQILVKPDLLYSCELIDGMVAAREDRPLSRQVATMGRLAKAKGLFAVVRVQAHVGRPWNELADCLAKHCLSHDAVGLPDYPWLRQIAEQPSGREWWTLLKCNPRGIAMPPTVENRVTLGTAQAPIAAPLDLPDSDEPAQHATHIRILSYNALSLAEEEDLGTSGRRGGNKSGRLDVQFDRRGIHVAGLQESRTREGVSFTEHYKILSSGSQTDNGVNLFGCELWLHRTKAWDCEGQASLQNTHIVVRTRVPGF